MGEMFLQQGGEPTPRVTMGPPGTVLLGVMLTQRWDPPQKRPGGTEHSKHLLGWATAVSFSPPARRRGGVRDGASCTPRRQGPTATWCTKVFGDTKKSPEMLAFAQGIHQDPPLLLSSGVRGGQSKQSPCSKQPGGGKGAGDTRSPHVRAPTFVPGGPGRRR